MNRRDFLRASAGLVSLSLLPSCARVGTADSGSVLGEEGVDRGVASSGRLRSVPGWRPLVASAWVGRGVGAPPYDLFKRVVEAACDFSWLSKGDRVLVKLALNSGNPFPATTDPWSLWCTIRLLREKGAGQIIVGDQSGVERVHWRKTTRRGSTRSLCASAGLLEVIGQNGASPCFFEERGYDAYVPAMLPEGSHWEGQPVWMTSALEEVDHVVYLPRVSSHILADVTAALKIAVGFLREDSRRRFHRGGRHFYAMYEEVNTAPPLASKFRLAVISGRRVLSTFGPDNGHVSEPDYGLVAASSDLVGLELLAYAWLVWNRRNATPGYSRLTTGNLTRLRSIVNQGFVWYIWGAGGAGAGATPGIPLWQPGDIHCHPAIANAMRRRGGSPETLLWHQVNSGPAPGVIRDLEGILGVKSLPS